MNAVDNKRFLIEEFKKQEPDLLLRVVTNNSPTRFVRIAFESQPYGISFATYDKELRKFININLCGLPAIDL